MPDADPYLDAKLQEAVRAYQAGNDHEAEQFLKAILNRYPRSSEVWFWLSRVVSDDNKKKECLKRALRCDPGNKEAQQDLQQILDFQAEYSPSAQQGKESKVMPVKAVLHFRGRKVFIFGLIVGILLVFIAGTLLAVQAFTKANGSHPDSSVQAAQNNPAASPKAKISTDNVSKIKQLARWGTGNGYQSTVAFSPDGQWMVVRTDLALDIYDIHTLALKKSIDLNSADKIKQQQGKLITTSDLKNSLLQFWAGGSFLAASSSFPYGVTIWRTQDWKEITTIKLQDSDHHFIFSGDQFGIVFDYYAAGLQLYDLSRGEIETSFPDTPIPQSIAVSMDGKSIAIAARDFSLQILDTHSSHVQTISTASSPVTALVFSADGKYLLERTQDGSITVWSVPESSMLAQIQTPENEVSGPVVFSPDGSLFAAGNQQSTLKIWQTNGGKLLHDLSPNLGVPDTLGFSSDGASLVASISGTLTAWRVADGQEIGQPYNFEKGNTKPEVILSPSGDWLAWQGTDPSWQIVDTQKLSVAGVIDRYTGGAAAVDVSNNGKMVAVGYNDAQISFFDVQSGKLMQTVIGQNSVSQVAFSPDDQTLAAGYQALRSQGEDDLTAMDSTLELWQVKSGNLLQSFGGQANGGATLISPDGAYAAAISGRNRLRVWRVKDGAFLFSSAVAYTAAFSHDGSEMAVTQPDYSILLIETQTGKSLQVIRGQSGYISSLSFSADDKLLTSISEDKTLRIYSLPDPQTVLDMPVSDSYEVVIYPGDQVFGLFTSQGIELHKIAGGQLIAALPGDPSQYVFAPDGSGVAELTKQQDESFLYAVNVIKFADPASFLIQQGSDWKAATQDLSQFTGLAYSADGKRLLTATAGGSYAIWDLTANKLLSVVKVPTGNNFRGITSAAWSADDKTLALVDAEGRLVLVDTASGLVLKSLPSPAQWGSNKPSWLRFSTDGQRLLLQSSSVQALWDLKDGEVLADLSGCDDQSLSVCNFDDNLDVYTSLDNAGQVVLTRLGNPSPIVLMGSASDTILSLDFSPDGKILAAGGVGDGFKRGLLSAWDVTAGNVIYPLVDFGNQGETIGQTGVSNDTLAISHRGAWVASGGSEGILRIWLASDGSLQLRQRMPVVGKITGLVFSPDDQLLLVAMEKGPVYIYHTQSWRNTQAIPMGSFTTITHAVFSPDGSFFILSDSSMIMIYATGTGELLGSLSGHAEQITGLAITPDGKMIVSSSLDGTIRFWGIPR